MAYWLGRGYLGIGPGAHGRLKHGRLKNADGTTTAITTVITTATNNWKKPEAWLRAVTANNNGRQEYQQLSAHESGVERLMMGLRISEGVAMSDLPKGVVDQTALKALCYEGFLKLDNGRLILRQKGQRLLDHILVTLLA